MIKKLSERYDQLSSELPEIEATKRSSRNDWGNFTNVDSEMFSSWTVKSKNLISKTCGENSQHMKAFEEAEKKVGFDDSYAIFKRLRPIFLAAKDDFQGGFLASIKNLVQAELFDSELDQARELLSSGYKGPAAVVTGVVLETTLKDLCGQHNISPGKLDKMNSDLAKIGIYNKLQQKKITALADIRNNAAHGNWNDFSDSDVTEMIRDVEGFLQMHLA
ncbi:hypothetical protein [Aurantivibrio plasticivorans]